MEILKEQDRTIKALKAYNNNLLERLQVVEAKKAGMFKASQYKTLQNHMEKIEEERNMLRDENKMMKKYIDVMNIDIMDIEDNYCPFFDCALKV